MARGRTRRRRLPRVLLVLALLAIAFGAYKIVTGENPANSPATASSPPGPLQDSPTAPLAGGGTAPSPLAVRIDQPGDASRSTSRSRRAPRCCSTSTPAGCCTVDPTRVLPIASLTKMMTALVVVERVPEGAKVKITNEAMHYKGSGVGVLPRGKWIGVNTMLHGLLLPSGNDAAIALAQRAAGAA